MKQRNAERVRTFLGAQIIFNDHQSVMDCHVRNISWAGAKLAISSTVALPDQFDLYIPQKHTTYKAQLRWRAEGFAGVEFANAKAPASEQPVRAEDKILALEAENAALKAKVNELTKLLAISREQIQGADPSTV